MGKKGMNNFELTDNEVTNLVSVLGAARGAFDQQAREHASPNGIIVAWLKNMSQAATELIDEITKQHNENMKVANAEMHHTAGYHSNPNMSYLYRPK